MGNCRHVYCGTRPQCAAPAGKTKLNNPTTLWKRCLERLEREIALEEVNTWLRPLQPELTGSGDLRLLAPNDFVCEQVNDQYLALIRDFFAGNGFEKN